MRAARVESGSASAMPTITGNEYFFVLPGGVSITTPWISISAIFDPTCAKATGVRSVIWIFSRSGSSRITAADSTHAISSNCFLRSSSGTKKTLRPMSAPITSITCARVTLCSPAISICSLPSTRKRQECVP